MRVFCLTHDFDSGGASRSLYCLCRELVSQGHRIRLLSLAEPDSAKDRAARYASLGVEWSAIRFPWMPLSYVGAPMRAWTKLAMLPPRLPGLWRVREAARDFGPDVILHNGYPSVWASLLLTGVPKVIHAREVIDESSPGFPLFKRLAGRYLDAGIAIGPVEKAQLDGMGIPSLQVFNSPEAAPQRLPLPKPPPFRFGVFGQLTKSKGLAGLVRACLPRANELREKEIELHVFGGEAAGAPPGPAAALRAEVAATGASDCLKVRGWTDGVSRELGGMHLLVRPDSSGSPWGRDIIEAFSLGRPVIATGENPVFVTPATGALAPSCQPDELIGLMLAHADAGLLEAKSRAASAFAAEHFDPARNAARIADFLKSRLVRGDGARTAPA